MADYADTSVNSKNSENSGSDSDQRLGALGRKLSESRKEAIDGRVALGIEEEWTEDEEAYVGIDNANRHEFGSNYWSKGDPLGTSGTSRTRRDPTDTRSVVLPNITGPYCAAAAARLADMLLPVDEQPFEIAPTPIPEMVEIAMDETPITIDVGGEAVKTTRKEYAATIMKEAKDRAEAAQQRIDDWLKECGWTNEVRTIIEDAARIGTGVLKGPVPVKRRFMRWDRENGFDVMRVVEKTAPASMAVSVWDCFPDPACGENIHNGNYFWERAYLSRKQLDALKGTPGYIDPQIEACLQEGPLSTELHWDMSSIRDPTPLKEKNKFQVWFYYGCLPKEDWQAAQPIPGNDEAMESMRLLTELVSDMGDSVHVCATMVNHRVIKCVVNPFENGAFPYDFMPWQKRSGMPHGQGVSRQIRTAQRMVTAGTRNLMDNAALGGGPIMFVDPDVIEPSDGNWNLYARKVFLKRDGATMADVEKAVLFKTINMVTEELQSIIFLGLRFAEECSGMPAILQGQMGEKAPDRVGIVEMLQQNATATLRRLAKLFDDRVTEPHIGRYYTWLMQYGEDPKEKGDFQVITKGSTVLVERSVQNQELIQIMPLSLTPDYELDPKKAAEEYLRSRRFEPKRFQLDEEQKIAREKQQNPLLMAEIAVKNAEAAVKAAQSRKVAAEAIKVGVETQYTGIQTGQVVVAVPGVAPVTDVIIRNAADGLDTADTLPETSGTVPPNVTAEDLLNLRTGMRVRQNTSPASPPVPPSPQEGIGTGIETQRPDGLRSR